MKKTLQTLAGPMFILLMFLGALWLLHNELRHYHWHDFLNALAEIPRRWFWLAIGLTVLNYIILVGYDLLAIRYIRHPMKLGRVALASFLGYAVGNNFGTLLGGSTIRYRLYTSWGLSAIEIVKLVFILSATFWIGLFALSSVVFLVDPLTIPSRLHLPIATTRPLSGSCFGSRGARVSCAVRGTTQAGKDLEVGISIVGFYAVDDAVRCRYAGLDGRDRRTLSLPVILMNLTTLSSGGIGRLLGKLRVVTTRSNVIRSSLRFPFDQHRHRVAATQTKCRHAVSSVAKFQCV